MLLASDDAGEAAEKHEINVTPFIDVVLVLLIIFMVVAPLSTVTMDVKLPSVSAEPTEQKEPPLVLTLREDKSLKINDEAIAVGVRLSAVLAGPEYKNKDITILIRAGKGVSYESLMATMDELRKAGFLNIALEALAVVGKEA